MSTDRAPLTESLARSLLLLGELRRIDPVLRSTGVEYLVLKGLPLAVRLTGRIDGRSRRIRDNDILVRRRDVRLAVAEIRALGYEPLPNVTLESQLACTFEYELYRKVGGTTAVVEVHWAPFPTPLYPVDESWLWTRTENVVVQGTPFRVLDRPLTLLQLASHFVQHQGRAEWPLRDLALAWNAWQPELDPGDLRNCADQARLRHVFDFALLAAQDLGLLSAPLPPLTSRRARALRSVLPTTELLRTKPSQRDVRSLQLLALAPMRPIPRWLWLRLAPPPGVLAATRGRSLSRSVYWEYARRPLRALARALGRHE